MKKLILASQSPRRRGILETAQIPFEVEVSQVSEETDQTKPAKIVEELAGRKETAQPCTPGLHRRCVCFRGQERHGQANHSR